MSKVEERGGLRRPPERKMTFEEFLEWLDEDTWAEWVDGEVVMLSPASTKHQRICFFLARLMASWAEEKEQGEVFVPPFLVKLGPDLPAREPDIVFVSKGNLNRLSETYLDGPPDLVVEVTSPESISRDRGEKFVEYERAGVREYWLVDPEREQLEVWRLGPGGRFELAFAGREGKVESEALSGFWIEAEWLWREPPPSLREAAEKLGLR